MSANLNCRVSMFWNGSLVMEGDSTCVVATDLSRAFMDQFAGPAWKAWEARNLYRSRVLGELLEGRDVDLRFSDDTGAAHVVILAPKPQARAPQGDMLANGIWPTDMGA